MPPRRVRDTVAPGVPTTASGRRRYQLNTEEREALSRDQFLSQYVEMLLAVDRKWTYEEMAEQLGVTQKKLKNTSSDEDFLKVYQEKLEDLRRSPFVSAARARLEQISGLAVDVIREILEDTNASVRERREAALGVLDRIGINAKEATESNGSRELQEYLSRLVPGQTVNMQINIGQMIAATTPNEYAAALAEVNAFAPVEVIAEEMPNAVEEATEVDAV